MIFISKIFQNSEKFSNISLTNDITSQYFNNEDISF